MSKLIPERLNRLIRKSDTLRPVAAEAFTWKNRLTAAIRGAPDWFRYRIRRHNRSSPVPAGAKDPLHVVLITYHPALAREAKLAHVMKLNGFRVTLLMLDSTPFPENTRYFDGIHRVANAWEALRVLDEIGAQVVHLIPPADNFPTYLQIISNSRVPVVYDPYDCARGMFIEEFKPSHSMLRAERACFARASHVCARSLEPLYLRNHYNYRMPGITYFPEYCWEPPRRRSPRKLKKTEELHVVYAGGVKPEDRFPADEQAYCQYLEIGRYLAEQGIHLHLYPAPSRDSVQGFDGLYASYLAEENRNRFFHIHRPVPFAELLSRLSGYDAALHIFGPAVSASLGKYTPAKLHHSSAGKIFDYIQAGLPVLTHAGRHQRSLLRRYGEAVIISQIREAREKLTSLLQGPPAPVLNSSFLDVHKRRLGDMYRKVWISHGG